MMQNLCNIALTNGRRVSWANMCGACCDMDNGITIMSRCVSGYSLEKGLLNIGELVLASHPVM